MPPDLRKKKKIEFHSEQKTPISKANIRVTQVFQNQKKHIQAESNSVSG